MKPWRCRNPTKRRWCTGHGDAQSPTCVRNRVNPHPGWIHRFAVTHRLAHTADQSCVKRCAELRCLPATFCSMLVLQFTWRAVVTSRQSISCLSCTLGSCKTRLMRVERRARSNICAVIPRPICDGPPDCAVTAFRARVQGMHPAEPCSNAIRAMHTFAEQTGSSVELDTSSSTQMLPTRVSAAIYARSGQLRAQKVAPRRLPSIPDRVRSAFGLIIETQNGSEPVADRKREISGLRKSPPCFQKDYRRVPCPTSMIPTPPWYTRLIKVCQRLGRSPEEAEDLVQDAYVRFLEYRRGADVRDEEALLSRIVANLAINEYHRERALARFRESLDDVEEEANELVDEWPEIERLLAAQERLREVEKTLTKVSERTCQIFIAQRAGFSYEEIAAEFKISTRTVQKHIVRATILLGMKPKPPSRF